MSQQLAIEWDAREARVILAQSRRGLPRIDHAFTIDLAPRAGQRELSTDEIGERIQAALSARNIGRVQTHVLLGRANLELRFINVPPAPADELPAMVRIQAARHFSNLAGDWPLDFVPVSGEDEATTRVLAATVSPKLVAAISDTCRAAQLTPLSLVLRPFAAAALWRGRSDRRECTLTIDMLADELDLTVLAGDKVALTRTVRMAAAGDQLAPAIVSEVRRTIASAQNQLSGEKVQRIVIFGGPDDFAGTGTSLGESMKLPVEICDPFDDFTLSADLRSRRPQSSGRYAPLLGMIADVAGGRRPDIDFLHPRQAPSSSLARRPLLVAVAAAACVLLAIGLVTWWKLQSLDAQIERLAKQSASWDTAVEKAEQLDADVGHVDRFVAGDVCWLDELRELSAEFPPPEQVIVGQWTAAALDEGGQMGLEGIAQENSTISEMERALRDTRHQVFGKGGTENTRRETYRWEFSETIIVRPTDDSDALADEVQP